jgi:hypothetical protein
VGRDGCEQLRRHFEPALEDVGIGVGVLPVPPQQGNEFATRVYEECAGGERLCGDCKEQAARLMEEFLADHQEKREEAKEVLAEADVDLDVAETRRG